MTSDSNRSLSPSALLGVMWLIYMMIFIFRVLLSPLLPLIEEEYHISHGQSSMLVTALSLTFALIQFPAGMVATKFGIKRSIVTCLFLSALCAIMVFIAPSFWWLLLVVTAMGLALGIYYPPAITLLSRLFPYKQVGRVLGVHETASQAGIMIGSIAAGSLAPILGWQEIFLVLSIPTFSLTLVFAFMTRKVSIEHPDDSHTSKIPRKSNTQFMTILKRGGIGLLLVPYTLNCLAANGLSSMLPLFLVEVHGLDVATAAYTFAASRVGSISGSFFGGELSDHIGRRKTQIVMMVLAILSSASVAFLPWGIMLIGATMIFSFTTIAYLVATIADISETLTPEQRPVGIGLYGTIGGIISGLAPLTMGLLADVWGFKVSFLFPIACCILGMIILVAAIRLANSRIVQSE